MRPSHLFTLLVPALASILNRATAQEPGLRGNTMLDCSGLPCVEVTLANGKYLRLAVDTGNVNSVLDTEVAKQAGLSQCPIFRKDISCRKQSGLLCDSSRSFAGRNV